MYLTCDCGCATFKEISKTLVIQAGVRVLDNGEMDYEAAGPVKTLGCGDDRLLFICAGCGKEHNPRAFLASGDVILL